MKWLTVSEYAKKQGISLAAAYKRIKTSPSIADKKFGKLVVKDSPLHNE